MNDRSPEAQLPTARPTRGRQKTVPHRAEAVLSPLPRLGPLTLVYACGHEPGPTVSEPVYRLDIYPSGVDTVHERWPGEPLVAGPVPTATIRTSGGPEPLCPLELGRACSTHALATQWGDAADRSPFLGAGLDVPSCGWDTLSNGAGEALLDDGWICGTPGAQDDERAVVTEDVSLRRTDRCVALDAVVRDGSAQSACTIWWYGTEFSARTVPVGKYTALACAWQANGSAHGPAAHASTVRLLERTWMSAGVPIALTREGEVPPETAFREVLKVSRQNGWWREGDVAEVCR